MPSSRLNPSDGKYTCLQILSHAYNSLPHFHTNINILTSNAVVNEVAEQLAKLTETNEVEIHFIPSHTEDVIEQSKEIDELAKHAALLGDEEIDHDPFVSSYKLLLKKREKLKLIRYLKSHVKPSHFKGYPDRKLLIEGKIKNADETISVLNSDNVLLNRARTGHTRARVHLKNIKIEPEIRVDTANSSRNSKTSIAKMQNISKEAEEFPRRL